MCGPRPADRQIRPEGSRAHPLAHQHAGPLGPRRSRRRPRLPGRFLHLGGRHDQPGGDASARAITLSDSYESARYAIGAQEASEHRYRLDPSPEARTLHRLAAEEFAGAVTTARRVEDAEHTRLLDEVIGHQAAYLSAVRRVFAAVDRGQHARARAIDELEGDPEFDLTEELVTREAGEHRGEALASLRRVDRVESIVLWGTPVAFGIGLCLLGFFTSLLVRAVRRNEHQALHDPLTGLPNRMLFRDRVQQAVRHAERDTAPLTVMVVGLDRFKEVNDTLGHDTGDRVLCAVGPRLREALRASDTVARIGGDEFALLLPDMGPDSARTAAVGLRRALEEPFELPGLTAATEASVGIAHFPANGADADSLLQCADVAMFEAKEQHTGFATYALERDPFDPRRLALGGELRRAVSDDEFILHYQPKVNLRTDAVAGVEALVRWMHPERGLLAPGEFIGLAEHTGLMRPLTLWVLESALAQCRRWLDRDLELPVSVNLAVPSLLEADFATDVAQLLAKHRVPARLLTLEITEGAMMTDPVRAVRVLESLDRMGIDLSVERLRNRLFLAGVPGTPAGARAQDRQGLRAPHGHPPRGRADRPVRRSSWGTTSACASWPRVLSPPGCWSSCATGGATSRRGSSWGGRCRPRTSTCGSSSGKPRPGAPARAPATRGCRSGRRCRSRTASCPPASGGSYRSPRESPRRCRR